MFFLDFENSLGLAISSSPKQIFHSNISKYDNTLTPVQPGNECTTHNILPALPHASSYMNVYIYIHLRHYSSYTLLFSLYHASQGSVDLVNQRSKTRQSNGIHEHIELKITANTRKSVCGWKTIKISVSLSQMF